MREQLYDYKRDSDTHAQKRHSIGLKRFKYDSLSNSL